MSISTKNLDHHMLKAPFYSAEVADICLNCPKPKCVGGGNDGCTYYQEQYNKIMGKDTTKMEEITTAKTHLVKLTEADKSLMYELFEQGAKVSDIVEALDNKLTNKGVYYHQRIWKAEKEVKASVEADRPAEPVTEDDLPTADTVTVEREELARLMNETRAVADANDAVLKRMDDLEGKLFDIKASVELLEPTFTTELDIVHDTIAMMYSKGFTAFAVTATNADGKTVTVEVRA